jgi:hypothetical protein
MTWTNIVLGLMCISFFTSYVITYRKLTVIRDSAAQLIMISQVYKDLLDSKTEVAPEEFDTNREHFIKFLSDSRDWAFDYIEKVQAGLKKFIQEVEPQLDYYNKYGGAVEGMMPPHDFALKKISKEFEELKTLLPEEAND